MSQSDNGRGKNQGSSLTTDGISEEFFDLLWQKDELNFAPSINIPDTIIFKYGQPVTWYFTAQSGRIKKKNRANLIGARIEEAFTKYILGYDVIASFISVPINSDSDEGNDHPTTTIEFLDREGLTTFLYNRKKEDSNGILQRFIEPKGVKNELIRAVWSPKLVLLERSENIHQLHDRRYGLYERCVTLEGPEYYSNSAPLRGPVLAGQIQKICENIVSHLSEVTFGQKQVSRFVVNYKVDSRDKIWLVYSTSIRINDMLDASRRSNAVSGYLHRHLVNIDNVVEIPNNVNLNPVPTFEKVVAKRKIQCVSCGHETLNDMRHPVTYKMVIKHYEHVLQIMSELSGNRGSAIATWPPDDEIIAAAGGVGFGCMEMVSNDDAMRRVSKLEINKSLTGKDLHIPPVLRYLHPKLTGKSYVLCRKDPLFLYKTATICEPCYLVYAEFTTLLLRMGGDNLNKILVPDQSALRSLQEQSISTSNTRPSSADWRAMSSVHRVGDSLPPHGRDKIFFPSKNHSKAKKASIGLRSSDARQQPNIPRAIRMIDDVEPIPIQYSVDSYGSMLQIPSDFNTQLSLNRSMTMGYLGSNVSYGGGTSTMDTMGNLSSSLYGVGVGKGNAETDLSAIIKEREKHFFNEIANNPQLKSQHPLMHLISAQQKIKMADENSGILATTGKSHKMPLFGTIYGQQGDNRYEPLDVIYGKEQPYMFKGVLILPSEFRRQKQEKIDVAKKAKIDRLRRKQVRNAELSGCNDNTATNKSNSIAYGDSNTINADVYGSTDLAVSADGEINLFEEIESPGGGDIISTKSAKKHREFLRETLKALEVEVDKSSGFLPGGEFYQQKKSVKTTTSTSTAGVGVSKKILDSREGDPVASTKNSGATTKQLVTKTADAESFENKSPSTVVQIDVSHANKFEIVTSPPQAKLIDIYQMSSESQQDDGEDNLENFFKLAAAANNNSTSGVPREAKSAGLRNLTTADSSRPSTTATGRRDEDLIGVVGLGIISTHSIMGLGPTSPVHIEGGKSLPRIASDKELLEISAGVMSSHNFSCSSNVEVHRHHNSSKEVITEHEDMMVSDSSTMHLLNSWGVESVHHAEGGLEGL